MADDLEDLKARVAAARERLNHDVDFAQKVELRLNDLARIVEGSLARQSAELETAQARIATLDEDLVRALARAEQAAGDAARADRLAKENGELRSMVMTLLEVIEGRQKSSLASVMQKLEENMSALVAAPAPVAEAIAVEESVLADTSAEAPVAEDTAWDIPLTGSGQDAAPEPAVEDEIELEMEPEAEPAAETNPTGDTAPMEDLSEIALYDAADEVIEPAKP